MALAETPPKTSVLDEVSVARPQKPSSDRSFGLVMTGFFALIGAAIPLIKGHEIHPILCAIAAFFLIASLARPASLAPLNVAWAKLADILHRITSPIVMAVMFFGVFTPLGWILRITSRDFFGLKLDRSAKSYWIERPSDEPSSMKNQF